MNDSKARKGFPKLLHNAPKESIWTSLYYTEAAPKESFGDWLSKFSEAVPGDQKWRRQAITAMGTNLIPLLKRPLATITPQDVENLTKKLVNHANRRCKEGILQVIRFAHDGVVGVRRPVVGGPSSQVVVRQRQFISEVEALALINAGRGKHTQFREELIEQMRKLPTGQAYAFVPENLSKDPQVRKKELVSLKNAVDAALRGVVGKYKKAYLPAKNLFIIMHRKPKKGA